MKSFLPQIESSNAALASADPAAIDIENVTIEQEEYIEMVCVTILHPVVSARFSKGLESWSGCIRGSKEAALFSVFRL